MWFVAAAWLGFPFVIAIFEQDMPGIEPGQQGWRTLTNELQEVRYINILYIVQLAIKDNTIFRFKIMQISLNIDMMIEIS